jgi:hypothetical protein
LFRNTLGLASAYARAMTGCIGVDIMPGHEGRYS